MNENMRNFCIILLSLPVWERGLKFVHSFQTFDKYCRSPCGSVDWNLILRLWYTVVGGRSPCGSVDWNDIEAVRKSGNTVAPRVGAWIEIFNLCRYAGGIWSLPVWERGLKYCFGTHRQWDKGSLPVWERGLKYGVFITQDNGYGSLPVWERGLKLS